MRVIRGKTVLVTGAASGIGRATALEFAREGAEPLVINDIDEPGLERTSEKLASLGCDSTALPADVSDYDAVLEMCNEARKITGAIDVLVNVAGIGIMCPVEGLDISDWRRVIEVDLLGTVNTCYAVLPDMVERGSGHVVNISSVSGLWANILHMAPYVTAKHGVVGLSRALRVECSLHGVGVSCVCPGVVKTPAFEANPIKGFSPEIREQGKLLFSIGEEPSETARSIVRAVKKNRPLVVTTPFYRTEYFIYGHFRKLSELLDRLWPHLIDRFTRKYRT